ncbi:Spy0128 family protein [Miniphocaeibacter halophilus]|uniref:Uncharacterized protein n=1 Tax=Miniphocaeibacter halophilus TaxID=2931922 RepID=A0AC61MSB6_9FIRM|nr:FctA domain-containing protein [Miniphocaeibacter halophilus]QQK08203.1 hypothetical protein JFY71_01310 [Miniphocaeibacter halophilus]
MRKKHKKLSLFLVIIMMINIFIPFSNIRADNNIGENVTDKITLEKTILYLLQDGNKIPIIDENGNKVEPQPEIKNGDTIKIRFEWSVSKENLKDIKNEDYFTIDLPDSNFVDMKIDEPQDLICDGEFKIGTFIIKDGKIITTFNEEVEKKIELKNGYFEIEGYLISDGDLIISTEEGEITIKVDPKTDPPGPGHGDGKNPISEDKLKFTKDGRQYQGKNKLNWHININYDQLANMIASKKITNKYNMIFEDEITDGLEIDEKSFNISTPLFVPTPEKTMSDTSITYRTVKTGEILRPNPEEKYEDFYNRIKGTSTPVIGIFDKTILIGFGSLTDEEPGNGITYDGLMDEGESLNNIIDTASDLISQEQKDYMKIVYSKEGISKGQVLAYDISFDTIVTDKATDKKYVNKATIRWNEKDEDSSEWEIEFKKAESGVESVDPGELRIKKLDNENNTISGVVFKIQKQNEEGKYIDYEPLDNGELERTTNEEGIVEFKKLEPGQYKIIEVKSPPGYGKAKYIPSEFFEIRKDDKVGVYVEVVNPIIKPAKVSIKGSKELTGRDLENNEFSFVLVNDENDEERYTGKNTGTSFSITGIKIPKAGEYTYTLTEEKGRDPDINYDEIIYKVKITASINEETNELETKIEYLNENGEAIEGLPVFNNTYIEPQPIEVEIVIEKELRGRKLKANQFSFVLEGIENTKDVRLITRNDEYGFGSFEKLEFKEEGVYKYKIFERKGKDSKIKYDDVIYELEVKVELNSDNKLVAKICLNGSETTSPVKVKFTNFYGSTTIEGNKKVENIKVE